MIKTERALVVLETNFTGDKGYYAALVGNITEDAIKKHIQGQSDESHWGKGRVIKITLKYIFKKKTATIKRKKTINNV